MAYHYNPRKPMYIVPAGDDYLAGGVTSLGKDHVSINCSDPIYVDFSVVKFLGQKGKLVSTRKFKGAKPVELKFDESGAGDVGFLAGKTWLCYEGIKRYLKIKPVKKFTLWVAPVK